MPAGGSSENLIVFGEAEDKQNFHPTPPVCKRPTETPRLFQKLLF